RRHPIHAGSEADLGEHEKAVARSESAEQGGASAHRYADLEHAAAPRAIGQMASRGGPDDAPERGGNGRKAELHGIQTPQPADLGQNEAQPREVVGCQCHPDAAEAEHREMERPQVGAIARRGRHAATIGLFAPLSCFRAVSYADAKSGALAGERVTASAPET